MNRAFIQGENPLTNGWKISRMKYFFVIFACAWWYVTNIRHEKPGQY